MIILILMNIILIIIMIIMEIFMIIIIMKNMIIFVMFFCFVVDDICFVYHIYVVISIHNNFVYFDEFNYVYYSYEIDDVNYDEHY